MQCHLEQAHRQAHETSSSTIYWTLSARICLMLIFQFHSSTNISIPFHSPALLCGSSSGSSDQLTHFAAATSEHHHITSPFNTTQSPSFNLQSLRMAVQVPQRTNYYGMGSLQAHDPIHQGSSTLQHQQQIIRSIQQQ